MSRNTSLTFRNSIFSSGDGEVFILLLKIEHSDLSDPILLSSDNVDTVSNGETYLSYPFQITLPMSAEDTVPSINLVLDNVHRDITVAIRNMTTPPVISTYLVLASSPDTIEAQFPDFTLRSVTYDRLTITGTLNVELLESEPFPGESYNIVNFPGLF